MLGPRPPPPAPTAATPRPPASIIAPRRPSARRPAAAAVLLALLAAATAPLPGAFAHGYLRYPRSRNHVASWGQDGDPRRDCSKEDCSKVPRLECVALRSSPSSVVVPR